MHPRAPLLTLLLLVACELERVGPASEGSASATAAAQVQELERLSAEVGRLALSIQAASDPEAVAGGAELDVEAIQADLQRLRAQRDALAAQLEELEAVAVSPRD